MFLPIIGKFVKHKANWSIRMAQLRIVLMIRNIIIIMQTELPIILPNNMWIAPQSRLLWMLEIYKNDWYWLFESPWHFRTVNHHAKHPEKKKNMSTDVHGCPRMSTDFSATHHFCPSDTGSHGRSHEAFVRLALMQTHCAAHSAIPYVLATHEHV